MAEAETQVWRYEPRTHDPDESQAAWKEILDDEDDILTELDLSDEHENGQIRLLVHQTAEPEIYVYDGSDTGLTVDFNKSLIKLSPALADMIKIDEEIAAKQVRHCSLPWFGVNGERNDGRVVRLSTWDEGRGVRNLYLVADDAKTALMLLNAVNRLVFETSKKSKPRTTKFHVIEEGTISMAMTSATERDQRDEIKLRLLLKKAEKEVVGSVSMESTDDDSVETLPALRDSEFYFTLDEEALCVYDHYAALITTHDFRFYRELTDKSIETIYSCHDEDQLELQRGDHVFYLHPASTQQPESIFQDLVNYLKAGHIKPKPERVFTAVSEFNLFYSPTPDVPWSQMMSAPSPASQQQQPGASAMDRDRESTLPPIDPAMFRMPFPSSKSMQTDVQFPRSSMQQEDSGAAARSQGWQQADSGAAARSQGWLNELNTGSHLTAASEDLQMMWFEVEPHLNQVITENLVTGPDIDSAGLDPQSAEHLQKLIEEIKDQMLKNNYGEAVGHLRACMKVYGATLLQELAACAELEIMKRIYFLSG